MIPKHQTSQFTRNLWASTGLVLILAFAIGLYIRAEQHLNRANEYRQNAMLLADGLRQSGDELTRFVRTYVVTGDIVYKHLFQHVLDIRNGVKPRPENYWRPYWDLMLPGDPPPRPDGPESISLLDLLRAADFTEEEFGKLAESKANSDALSLLEMEAMALAESTTPNANINQAAARAMLYDNTYHQAKASVMKPIDEFWALMDQRTLAEIHSAKAQSTVLRYVFVLIGCVLLFMLRKTYMALQRILGGTPDVVLAHISRMGDGDFSTPILVGKGAEDSVLGYLAETQTNLCRIELGRKKAEAQVLLQSTAMNAAANAIVIMDDRGTIAWTNDAYSTMTGYSREEAVGQNARALVISEQHDEASNRELWNTIQSGHVWRGELINKKKHGSLYTETLVITPLFDKPHEISHFIAIKDDITEKKLLEESFHQAQKMECIGRLAGGVAHDFNNMLSVIIGYAEYALAEIPENDPLFEDIQEIRNAGEKASALTGQLLAFSRKQVLQPKVLDLCSLVDEEKKMLGRLIGEDIQLSISHSPNLYRVRVDPSQIGQVLMNLAVNARDAMPQGGKLMIELKNAELDATYATGHIPVDPGSYLMLAVSDNGEGMDKLTVDKIFDPFFTTKEMGKGTGLGLSTVYGIVKQSSGHIFVYSEVGRGTTFKLYFPRVTSPESDSRPALQESVSTGTESILLVEDDDALRDLAERILVDGGYTVFPVGNGEDAINLFERQNRAIDLLVTDVVMPGMNGRQLAQHLIAIVPRLRVLYMSGYTDDSLGRNGDLVEGMHFLSKPFSRNDLQNKVREVIQRTEIV